MFSVISKFNSGFDYFAIGDLIAVFFLSELGSRARVVGFCTGKDSVSGSFEVFVKGEVTYRFTVANPNLVRVYNLRSKKSKF